MPKIKGTKATDKKSYLKVLEVMKLGVPITPTEIDTYIGIGKYSSKYICFLKREGYQFSVQKDKRNVITYTLIGVPKTHGQVQNVTITPKTQAITKSASKTTAVKSEQPKKIKEKFSPEELEKPAFQPENPYTVDEAFDSFTLDDIEF